MGTVCAPSYTNLIMAPFQEKHIYSYIKDPLYISKMTYLSYGKKQKNN